MSGQGRAREGRLAQARRLRVPPYAVPAGIFLAVVLLGLLYVSRPAFVWDEMYYYPLSARVGAWVAAPTLDEEAVTAAFREGNAHPPLPLYVMAATSSVFQAESGDFLLAVRMATLIQLAALAVVVFLFVRREAGPAAAAFACVLTVFSPRLFAHGLMATYDVPLAFFWVATTAAFYLGMRSRRWAHLSGVFFGLALLVKVNAFLLPLALWPWGLHFHGKRSLRAIVSMCVAGPLVFFAGWPWLWLSPFSHFAEYLVDKFPPGVLPGFLVSLAGAEEVPWREVMPTLYFGEASPEGVPWHYPFVMSVFTMPLATLAGCAAAGAGSLGRGLLSFSSRCGRAGGASAGAAEDVGCDAARGADSAGAPAAAGSPEDGEGRAGHQEDEERAAGRTGQGRPAAGRRPLVALLVWSIFVQLAVFAFGMEPYDGVRLFLPVLVLSGVLGGLGLARLFAGERAGSPEGDSGPGRGLSAPAGEGAGSGEDEGPTAGRKRGGKRAPLQAGWLARRRRPLAACALLVALSPVAEVFVYQPWGMSYYSPLVGGLPGAERLGMEATYYGEAVDVGAFRAISARASEGDGVAYAPMFRDLPWRMPHEYIQHGFLSSDLRAVAPWEDWRFLIFVNRGGQVTEADRSNLASGEVIHENRLLGVTLSKVVMREDPEGAADASGRP